MPTIVCPECGTAGELTLVQTVYEGPYRCWKCRQLFLVRIENNEVCHQEPLSEEDLAKWLDK